MRYEDITKDLYLLQKGVEKIVKYGMATFTQYANEMGLSYCDRNRVIAKTRLAYGLTGLKEIPCPPELLQERLDYYVSIYGRQKAISMLEAIDNTNR